MAAKKHGVYMYWSVVDGELEKVIYVGVCRDINNAARHKEHLQPARKDKQKINTHLQEHKEDIDWHYTKVCEFEPNFHDVADRVELLLIQEFQPIYNINVKTRSK